MSHGEMSHGDRSRDSLLGSPVLFERLVDSLLEVLEDVAEEAVAAARAGMRNQEIQQAACRRSSHRSSCRHAESGNSASSMPGKQAPQPLPACGIGKFGKQHAGEASAASPAGMWNWEIRQAACRRSKCCKPCRHAESGNSVSSMPGKQAPQPMPACGIGKHGKQHAGE